MAHSTIFSATYPRTLDELVARLEGGEGVDIAAWTFDDAPARQRAEAALAQKGVTARFRSAYKPLLHFFLEEVEIAGLADVRIAYPLHENAAANRFTLEAYPLVALLENVRVEFTARTDTRLSYDVKLVYSDGRQSQHEVFAPNRVHADAIGQASLSPTGWLIAAGENARLETDYEKLFAETMKAIVSHEWGHSEPYFEELNIRIALPFADMPLAYDEEVMSLIEALHEDVYFSCLEFFQKKSGRPSGDRGLQPGQIVPEIVLSEDEISMRVETRGLSAFEQPGPHVDLDTAQQPLFVSQIVAELETIGGDPFTTPTRSGRTVHARYISGSDVPVIISAGQHANETTGVVGALRAAHVMKARPAAHFTISPQENPDGYALHHRLRADNPRHMHHAARYTALGDDLGYRTVESAGEKLFEKGIRVEAERLSGAQLHVNLHGYPAHEWTRPLSGYVPRNFRMWTLPKGFFLILDYHSGWHGQAEQLIDLVTRDLGEIPGLAEYNARQIDLYRRHAGETGFRIVNGFPCIISTVDRYTVPLTLITEYPDETIYGQKFIDGHTAQMRTVLAAYDAWQKITAVS